MAILMAIAMRRYYTACNNRAHRRMEEVQGFHKSY